MSDKMKKVMLLGKQGAGKTTLIQRLNGEELVYRKTQSLVYYDNFLDSPGEYIENKRLLNSILVSSVDYDVIALLQQSDDLQSLFPPFFSSMFQKPTIGIVTKTDLPDADVSNVEELLEAAGAEKVFLCSAYTGEGIDDIDQYISYR